MIHTNKKMFAGILRMASLGFFLASCDGGDDGDGSNDNSFVLHVETGASGGAGASGVVDFCKPGLCNGPRGRGGAGGRGSGEGGSSGGGEASPGRR